MNIFRLTVLAMALSPACVLANDAISQDRSYLTTAAVTGEEAVIRADKMQERMLRMHEHMHKIMRAKDGVERERLLQEHRMMIEENMGMMYGSKAGSDCLSKGM